MPDRFVYSLQAVLDAAVAGEREASLGYVSVCAEHAAEERALERLGEYARHVRAELVAIGTRGAALYVEVGLRLGAIGKAQGERRTRVGRARGVVENARARLAESSRRRLALERHRARTRERYDRAEAARQAAEFDEANILRRSGSRAFSRG